MSQQEVLKEQLAQTIDTYVKYVDVDTGNTVSVFLKNYLWQKEELTNVSKMFYCYVGPKDKRGSWYFTKEAGRVWAIDDVKPIRCQRLLV